MVYEITVHGITIKLNEEIDQSEIEAIIDHITSEIDACNRLKTTISELEESLNEKRSDLIIHLDKYNIKEVQTPTIDLVHSTMKRFTGYKDEDKVWNIIPEKLRNLQTLSLDRKKINALIDNGELPRKIKYLEVLSEPIHRLTFKEKKEKD